MHRSGPRPLVISMQLVVDRHLVEVDRLGLAVLCAICSRSGTRSMAITRPAPSIQALRMQNWPTGPHPHTATVSPVSISAFSAAMYPVGKMSDRNTTFSSGMPSGIFSTLASAGPREELGLPAGVPAGQVRVPVQPGRRLPHHLPRPPWRSGWCCRSTSRARVWQNQHSPQAMSNGTTIRSPFLNFVTCAADLDDLAHRLVAEDVARLHGRQVHVVQVQVRAADAGGRDLDDHVRRVLDLRVRDGVAPDVGLAVPAERFHEVLGVYAGWRVFSWAPITSSRVTLATAATVASTRFRCWCDRASA